MNVKVVKRRKDFIEAHIIDTKKYDPHFADGEIFCPHYFIPRGVSEVNAGTEKIGCGGCKWQMMSYERQLELKQQLVEEAFKKVNNILKADQKTEIRFLPMIGSPLTQGYRNKIEFSFGVYKQQTSEYREREKQQKYCRDNGLPCPNGKAVNQYLINNNRGCGFHKQGEFSKIVDVDSCGLISAKANQIFQTIKKLCLESGLPVYDQKIHQGFFRHLVLREGVHMGQLMVNLSVCLANLNDKQTKQREVLLQQVKEEKSLRELITTFVITNNAGLADTVKNEKSETSIFRGEGHICELLCSCTFRISPFSFFQTNTHGAEELFSTAFKMLGDFEGNILDLYCGTGSIGLSLLKMANISRKKGKKGDTQYPCLI
ncbi:MAG: hypothetical protein LBD75_00345 [Candidatus Peribacteria bacterium]|nr:hypothetical protein [Candidatus Peribacteria bacterium]